MDQPCEYCKETKNDLYLFTLPCGFTVCQDHLNDYSSTFWCFMCNEHSISKETCLKMKKNRDKINKIKFLKESDTFMSKLNEIKMLKNDPHHYIDEFFSNIINKIDLHREQIRSEMDKIFEKLYSNVNFIKSGYEQCLVEDLQEINIEKIEKNLDSNDMNYEDKLFYLKEIENDLFCPIFECLEEMNNVKFKINGQKFNSESFGKIINGTEPICLKIIPKKSKKVSGFGSTYIRELSNGELVGVSFENPENLKIWNPETDEKRELKGHKSDIGCVYTSLNDLILSLSDDFCVKIWDKEVCVNEYQLPSYQIYSHDFYDPVLVLYDIEFVITVKDFRSGKTSQMFQGHKSPVVCSKLLSRSSYLSCHLDGCIKLWNLKTGNCLKTFLDNASCVDKINDKMFITGSDDGRFCIWNVKFKNPIRNFKSCSDSISQIQVIEEDKFLSFSSAGYLVLWDNSKNFFKLLSKKIVPNLSHFNIISNNKMICLTNKNIATIWE